MKISARAILLSVTQSMKPLCCLLALSVAGTAAAEDLSNLVARRATPMPIVGDCKFTEGPAYSPQGYFVFNDIPNNRTLKVMPDLGISEFLKPSGEANGMAFDAAGRLYICQGEDRRIVRMDDPRTRSLTVLCDSYDGRKLNSPNDLSLDNRGGVYFTDPRYRGNEPLEQPVMGVYYIAASGHVKRVIEDLERPNGLEVSADGRYLFVAEPNRRQLYRYEILEPGVLSAGQLIYTGDLELDGAGPDGMTLDAHGNIYAAYNRLVVLTPQGELIGRVELPEHPSNCTFGGSQRRTLFITARSSVYTLDMQVEGLPLRRASTLEGSRISTTVLKFAVDPLTPEVIAQQTELALADAKPETPAAEAPKAKTKEVAAGDVTLKVPESWKQKELKSQFRVAEFEIPAAKGDETPGELAVFFFGATGGGGVDANITRWIGQFSEEGRTAKVATGKMPTGDYVIADISGTYNKPIGPPIQQKKKSLPGWRVLGVILQTDKGLYFLKLDGPAKTVAAAESDFRASFGGNAKEEKERKLPE